MDKGKRGQIGTMYGTLDKGPRYLELAEGYVIRIALDENNEIIGYQFVHLGKMMEMISKGIEANQALQSATGQYGRYVISKGTYILLLADRLDKAGKI